MHHRTPQRALLVLKDGRVFVGQAIGHVGRTQGEVVFNTYMTGYQEVLTDPSYDQQIVTFTYPHIGNVGVNRADAESERVWAAELVVKELSPCTSNYRAEQSLDAYLKDQKVVGIADVDTRALVRHIRLAGAQMAILTSDPKDLADRERLRQEAKSLGTMEGLNLVDEVTCSKPYDWNEGLFDLEKYDVKLLGANIHSIKKSEDRALFRDAMAKISLKTPRSVLVHSHDEALNAAEEVGFPAILCPAFTLGGTGGGIAYDLAGYKEMMRIGLDASPVSQERKRARSQGSHSDVSLSLLLYK